MSRNHCARTQLVGLLIATALLAGCVTLSPDGGIDKVQALARERIGNDATVPRKDADPAATAAATRELLQKPLTVEAAVRIALLNNADLKSSLAEVGISEADLVQAGRLPNPGFSFGNKRNSEVTTIDRSVMVSVMSLLTMPLAQEIAGRQYATTSCRSPPRSSGSPARRDGPTSLRSPRRNP